MIHCVIFVGLQGSGKTTFYQRRFASTHRHISKDNWPNAARRADRQAREIADALEAAQSFVVDNTNAAVADREAIIGLASGRARIIGYYFDATTREAIGRNRAREGRARVPDVAIFTTAGRMVVPARAEGFDELFRVSITPDGEFDVRPMHP
jgi:predicted kinase